MAPSKPVQAELILPEKVKTKASRQRGQRGRGCVRERQTKSGTSWVVQISFKDWAGKRHRPQLTFRTRNAALNGVALLEKNRAAKGKIAGSVITVSQMAQQWLHQVECASGTKLQREISLRKHILPYLGRRRVIEMDASEIDNWKNVLRDVGVGESARKGCWSVLRIMLAYAVQLRILAQHPMAGLDAPRRKQNQIVPFTEVEMQSIFDGATVHCSRYLRLLQVIYSLGLRQGEALGLQWTDLDWETGELQIRRQALDEGGKLVIKDSLKTKAGRRTLLLSPDHLAIFRAQMEIIKDEDGELPEWIFPGQRGKPLLRSSLRHWVWKPLLAKLGIPHRGLHHFRHTAATQMLLGGVSLLDVSGGLGHSKPETTLRLYAHVIDKPQGKGTAMLAALARQSGEPSSSGDEGQAAHGRLDKNSESATVRDSQGREQPPGSIGVTGFEPATSTSRT